MEAKELMIGDWYSLINPDGHKCIPQKITIDGLMLLCTDNRYNCDPIPLTEEILKVNGFVCNKYYLFSIPFGKYNFILEGSINNNETVFCMNIYSNRIQLKYVHELQHALRLCGLNDLADNFKIE